MPSIQVGIALRDAERADIPRGLRVPEALHRYAAHLQESLGEEHLLLELHPSDPFAVPARYPDQFRVNRDNRWLNEVEFNPPVRNLIESGQHTLGVHQPPGGDPLSSNFFGKYSTLEETRRAMDFATGVGADYFVVNLAQQDKWGWSRSDQHYKGLKVFKEIATYYRSMGYEFVPCIETLPYPCFPATGGELVQQFNECQKLLAECRIALNIGHMWRSRQRMMATGLWRHDDVTFSHHLEYTLSQTWEVIHLFHLGGCWESEIYAVPGLHPQQNPYHHKMKLRESIGVYQESGEIDLNRVLELLIEYTVARGRDLRLVLDIRERDIGQVVEAARQIQQELVDRYEALREN